MRRYSLNTRKLILALVATFVASLGVATTAQAIVLNDTYTGGTEAGVALAPSTRYLGSLPANVLRVTSGASCTDPWLSPDLGGPAMRSMGLCYRGGAVMNRNETFALTWDAPQASPWALRNYWAQTRGYVERFLRDAADASGSLGSPFALTSQFNDAAGRAQNASIFGGGCIDSGAAGGSACEFGSPTGAGHDFASGACDVTYPGDSLVDVKSVVQNSTCLTEGQLQTELRTMISQTGIIGRTQPGYTPLVTLLLPPGVETCLDQDHRLCSTNAYTTPPPADLQTSTSGGSLPDGTYEVELMYELSNGHSMPSSAQTITTSGGGKSTITIKAPAAAANETGWYAYVTGPDGYTFTLQSPSTAPNADFTWQALSDVSTLVPPAVTAFCSYHSQVNVGGTEVAYTVQPWTAGTSCDEPGLPNIPQDPTPQQLSVAVGSRLVSPLSQAEIAAIINPGLNGWVAGDGSEIEDNKGCNPLPRALDSVSLGSSSQNPYYLQREWNNGTVLDSDPNTYGCAPAVILTPDFVVPSSVNEGDVVQFDGSASASTLVIPQQGYSWNFGDGNTATGPSVVHTYKKAGTFAVTLTTTDRGGNTSTLKQTIQVLGSDGQPAPVPTGTNGGGGSGGSGPGSRPVLNVHFQLLPQSLKSVLNRGIAVRVSSNRPANGIATVWLTRAAARRAHIKTGKAASVRIGIGTVSSIKDGTVTLRLHLSRAMAKKLRHLRHVTMTVRLALVGSGTQRLSIVAAGRY